MEEKCTNTIVESAKNAFNAAILLGSIWTCEAEDSVVGDKEGADGDVVELLAVVSLDGADGATELGGDYWRVMHTSVGNPKREV
jgi:hypothetical protein